MNERMKELRKQAAKEVSNANQWTNDDEWDELFMEKFAELIVHECAAIGERYADGNYEVRNQIMVQFGLEEPEE
jgi:hypothetical protein